jgi:thiol-disulfide isomerase/thioredoxin
MATTDTDVNQTAPDDGLSKRDRAKQRRRARKEAERKAARRSAIIRRTVITLGIVVVVGGLAGGTFLAATPDVSDDSGSAQLASGAQPLPPDRGENTDAAAGADAPNVTGTDFDGNSVSIGQEGQAQALMFLAHWCPHCQRELPKVVDLVQNGRIPEGVELKAISTSHNASRGNWPPQDWLNQEGWNGPTLVDAQDRASNAYGMSGTPFFVFVNEEGKVVNRVSGEIPPDRLVEMMEQIAPA